MNDPNETRPILDQKINFFFKDKTLVHIRLKGGTFYNGIITEISADFFIFKDRKLGLIPVFLLEVERIEPFLEDNNKR